MAFFKSLGNLFGLTRQKRGQGFEGAKIPDVTQIPGGQTLLSKLEQRAGGQGVGFDPNVLKRETSAVAAQRRAGLREQELPAISAQASARGVGKSTIPVNRAALATQAAERDIESRLAQLSLANEQQKQQDITNALSQLGATVNLGGQLGQARSAQELGIHNQQLAEDLANEKTQQEGILKSLQTGLGFIGGGLTTDSNDAITGFDVKEGLQGATVPISGANTDAIDRLKLLKLLGLG